MYFIFKISFYLDFKLFLYCFGEIPISLLNNVEKYEVLFKPIKSPISSIDRLVFFNKLSEV